MSYVLLPCIQVGDRAGEGQAYGGLGNAYLSQGEFTKALQYHTQCLAIAKEVGNRAGEGGSCGNLGNAYLDAQLFKNGETLEYLNEGLMPAIVLAGNNGSRMSQNSNHALSIAYKACSVLIGAAEDRCAAVEEILMGMSLKLDTVMKGHIEVLKEHSKVLKKLTLAEEEAQRLIQRESARERDLSVAMRLIERQIGQTMSAQSSFISALSYLELDHLRSKRDLHSCGPQDSLVSALACLEQTRTLLDTLRDAR